MHTGKTIEELIQTVSRAEEHVQELDTELGIAIGQENPARIYEMAQLDWIGVA